jgi:hypothetical protein
LSCHCVSQCITYRWLSCQGFFRHPLNPGVQMDDISLIYQTNCDVPVSFFLAIMTAE